jgi:DNA sulfur modification protein DndB
MRLATGQIRTGVTPPIVLWTEAELKMFEPAPGIKALLLPFGLKFVAIDGETQLAARYEAAAKLDRLQQQFVPVVIHHGRDVDWARQAFHDLNALQIKPNTAVAISMDERDPLTQIAREVEKSVSFLIGRVNHRRRQLGKNDSDVMTISALRLACVTVAKGIGGIQYGARPIPGEELGNEIEQIQDVCVAWWDAVANAIGDEYEVGRRADSIATAPSALAAIGAFGHSLLSEGLSGADLEEAAADRAEELLTVNWTRGPHWNGIAGKMTPSGRLSIAGAKESAYVIYKALTDVNSEEFRVVRKKKPAALALA